MAGIGIKEFLERLESGKRIPSEQQKPEQFCAQEALTVYKERQGIDKHPQIVFETISGKKWCYYRSEGYIENLLEGSPIPCYLGSPDEAPDEYAIGNYLPDDIMNFIEDCKPN